MATHALALEEKHFRAAEEKARALGTTPEQYVQSLIEADSRSFDEILRPVREGFEGMSDAEIDDVFERATGEARRRTE